MVDFYFWHVRIGLPGHEIPARRPEWSEAALDNHVAFICNLFSVARLCPPFPFPVSIRIVTRDAEHDRAV